MSNVDDSYQRFLRYCSSVHDAAQVAPNSAPRGPSAAPPSPTMGSAHKKQCVALQVPRKLPARPVEQRPIESRPVPVQVSIDAPDPMLDSWLMGARPLYPQKRR